MMTFIRTWPRGSPRTSPQTAPRTSPRTTPQVKRRTPARADGNALPIAYASVDAVAALYTLHHYADPLVPIREARRVLRAGGVFAAYAANRTSDPELAGIVPGWGASTTFDGESTEAIISSVFDAPGDPVLAQPWNVSVTLSAVSDVIACLRVYGLSEAGAEAKATALNTPLTLTRQGCLVYGIKGLRRVA